LVGELLKVYRQVEAQRLGSSKIDHKLEFDRLLHRQPIRLCAFEYTIDVINRPTGDVHRGWPIGHQRAHLDEIPPKSDRRHTVPIQRRLDYSAVGDGESAVG